jgi:DNA-binding beta-propeller fold protein YncE
MILFVSQSQLNAGEFMGTTSTPHVTIIFNTLAWSIGVGLVSTTIGWLAGIRIASLSPHVRNGIVVGLLMTLAVPAYAVFYAWWQAWPSGTWLHNFLVTKSLLGFAMQLCAAAALVGWSWPIAALMATMATKTNDTIGILHRIDGLSPLEKWKQHFLVDWRLIVASVLLVATITAANTTCFDLAQVATIGNELRAVVATGGSFLDVPFLSFVGLFISLIATVTLFRFVSKSNRITSDHTGSSIPVIVVWVVLSGGPLLAGALASLRGGGFQLWQYYSGDMFMSGSIGFNVAFLCVILLLTSTAMHLSTSHRIRLLASCLDFIWILFAFLPASFVSLMFTNAWHNAGLDGIYQTPAILVLAHFARVGFIASLAGRWVASCMDTRNLCAVDGVKSPITLFLAIRPRLVSAVIVVIGITIAMSLGEVSLTSQLAPPAKFQPIAVALLNAMHYQRPEIVTSALFVIIAVALIGGILVVYTHRRFTAIFLLLCFQFACTVQDSNPIPDAVVIGGAGLVDERFMTPRAIAANNQMIVVIDKSGRLQRFDHVGVFISSWDLQLSGNGFPTGVSIDDDGLIWIADTHQHRILVLDQTGNEVLQFGSYGTDDGQFLYPTDIAFSEHGAVYVSEYGGNDRISVFDRTGKFQHSFGHYGKDRDGFKRPQSIAVEPDTGNLFITDSGNHRIVVRDAMGKVLQIISTAGREINEVLYPYGIVFVSPTVFMISEFGNNRLQLFTNHGVGMGTWGGAGNEIGLFRTPWGVAITSDGIIVADTGNNRLQLLPDIMSSR